MNQIRSVFKQILTFLLESDTTGKDVDSIKIMIIELLAKEVNNEDWINLATIYKNDKKINDYAETIAVLALCGPNKIKCRAYDKNVCFIWNRAVLLDIVEDLNKEA